MDAMLAHPLLGKHLAHPSLSYGSKNLYAHGIFEQVCLDVGQFALCMALC